MTMIFAHRGASKYAPENTMPAFELAIQMKAEGIETDVQLTKDNIPVLIHDERLKRTTNGRGYIKDYLYNELKQLDAGSWFSQEFAGTTILSLQEFLEWAQNLQIDINIELKNNKIDYKNLEHIIYEMVDHYHLLDRTTFSTFNVKSVQRLKQITTEIDVALLTSQKRSNLVEYAKELGANALHINYRLMKESLIQRCKQENLAVRVYTVNRALAIRRCIRYGCDGIFTDVPNRALHYRSIL